MKFLPIITFIFVIGISKEQIEITANALRVRKGPGTGYAIRDLTFRGAVYDVKGEAGEWIKIYHQVNNIIHKRFFCRYDDLLDETIDPVVVHMVDKEGRSVKHQNIIRMRIKPYTKDSLVWENVKYIRVGLLTRGWVHSAYTRKLSSAPERYAEKPAVQIEQKAVKLVKKADFIVAGKDTKAYLGDSKRAFSSLNDAKAFQVVAEQNGYFRIFANTKNMKDSVFVDVNKYYDLNNGDDIDLVTVKDGKLSKLLSVHKSGVRFKKSESKFGPGISRIAPAIVALPVWVKKHDVSDVFSGSDLGKIYNKDVETHPEFYLKSEATAQLNTLLKEDFKHVIKYGWHIAGDSAGNCLKLTINSSIVSDSALIREKVFEEYVDDVVKAYLTDLKGLSAFTSISFSVAFLCNEGGILHDRAAHVSIDIDSLVELKYENISFRELRSRISFEVRNV